MVSFLIEGGQPLSGEVTISGSKNASLPILAATLLTDEPCVLKNVPDIEDMRTMIEILRCLGKGVEFGKNTVTVWKSRAVYKGTSEKLSSDYNLQTLAAKRSALLPVSVPDTASSRIRAFRTKFANFVTKHSFSEVPKPIPQKLVCKMRASVLLLGPLLARFGKASLPLPGGCVLGKRSFATHLEAFEKFGIENYSTDNELRLKVQGSLRGSKVVLKEFSVTATENILLLASLISGTTEIHLAAIEPHVQDLCLFLQKLGVSIQGIGTHTLRITGSKKLRGGIHAVTPDYLEAGTFAIASAVTRGEVVLKNCEPNHLTSLWNLFEMVGVPFELDKNTARIQKPISLKACGRLQTAIYPGFPTDLQAPCTVLLTQCQGETRIHETLFEGRLSYLYELQKMGAHAEVKNEHEAMVSGGGRLHGTQVQSCDIRAGAAMILAGLAATGKTEVLNVTYIDRGYEQFDEKLRLLGAKIERLGTPTRKRMQPRLEHQFDIPLLPLR